MKKNRWMDISLSPSLHRSISTLDFGSIGWIDALKEETLQRLHGHRREESRATRDHALIELKLGVVEVRARAIIFAMAWCAMTNP